MGEFQPLIEALGEEAEAALESAEEAVETEAPVVENAVESAGEAVAEKAEALAQEAEAEGKTVLKKIGDAFGGGDGTEEPCTGEGGGGEGGGGDGPPPDQPPPEPAPELPPTDPTQPPGEGYEWRGRGPAGSSQGSWYNPETGEVMHPDLDHPDPIGPHWDYTDPDGNQFRWYPDGTMEPK